MEWKITHDAERNYVRAYQGGEFSLDAQATFLTAIFALPSWQSGTPLIIDYSSLEMGNIDDGMLIAARSMLRFLKDELGRGRFALLCADDEQLQVGQKFQSFVTPYLEREMSVFINEDAAIDWVTEKV